MIGITHFISPPKLQTFLAPIEITCSPYIAPMTEPHHTTDDEFYRELMRDDDEGDPWRREIIHQGPKSNPPSRSAMQRQQTAHLDQSRRLSGLAMGPIGICVVCHRNRAECICDPMHH